MIDRVYKEYHFLPNRIEWSEEGCTFWSIHFVMSTCGIFEHGTTGFLTKWSLRIICDTLYFYYTHDPEIVLNAAGCIEAILLPLSQSKRAMLALRSSANWSGNKKGTVNKNIGNASYFNTWSKASKFVAIFIEETIAYTSSIELFC